MSTAFCIGRAPDSSGDGTASHRTGELARVGLGLEEIASNFYLVSDEISGGRRGCFHGRLTA
jgi:hypothetical protein